MARKEVEFILNPKDEKELLKLIKGIDNETKKKRVVQDSAVKAFNPRLIKAMRSNAKRYWNTSGDTYKSIGFIKSRAKDSGSWFVDFGIRLGGKKGSRAAGYKQLFFEKGTVERATTSGANRGRISNKRPVFWPAYYSERDSSLNAFAEGMWEAMRAYWKRNKRGK